MWPLLDVAEDISVLRAVLSAVLFLTGWALSRGANNQKYLFKTSPSSPFLGFIQPRTVPGTRLLCSGWWGISRHINYLGEVLMALGLTLPGGFPVSGIDGTWTAIMILPWLYPLYNLALFLPREREDNKICEAKYGEAWKEYCKLVPYRIVPYLY